MKHYFTKYDGIKDLQLQFKNQLEKVLPQLTNVDSNNIEQPNNNENQVITQDKLNRNELKELLNNLKNAVLEEDLDEEEKEDCLEQIQKIEKALQNTQEAKNKKTAKKAMKMLRGPAADLSSNAAMVTVCNQLPDLIAKIF